jgi:glycolate oxidase
MHAADDEVVAAALALGGTITGEHGVGSEKTRQMRQRFTPVELAAQRAVKAAFDPGGILNPGVLLPDATADEPDLPIFAARLREALDARRAGRDWADPAQPVVPAADGDDRGIEIDAENLTVTVGAGTPPAELHRALAARRLHCPLPEEGNGADTIGAIVGGDRDRAAVRDWLLALRATLPEGAEVRFGSNAVKDVAGYDMKRLYIGTGAAFGLPRAVTLKVRPGALSSS